MKSAILKTFLLAILLSRTFSGVCAQTIGDVPGLDTPIPTNPTAHPKRPATIEGIRLGFSGFIPGDAWSPLRVYLSGNPIINSGAFGGTITVTYSQDASQSAEIITPVATTPGRVIPTEIIIALPRNAPDILVSLRDDAGRLVDERTYTRRGALGEQFPGLVTDNLHVCLLLSEQANVAPDYARFLSAPNAPQHTSLKPGEEGRIRPAFEHLARVLATEEELPQSDTGLDGLFAVFAKSDQLARLPRAKSEALARWVNSGGCLVVIANPGPQNWTNLFDDDPLPFRILESAIHPAPPDLIDDFKAQPPVSSIAGRSMELTEAGPDRGWRVRWTNDAARSDHGPSLRGLLAEGPAGLGWIIILGAPPDRFTSSPATGIDAWRNALREALAEPDSRPFRASINGYVSRGSGPDQSARTAIRSLMNTLADIPPIGDAAFFIVAVSLFLLAVALGPFDAFFLGIRRLRPWSWATALGWIAIAAAIAAIIPPLVRNGSSVSRRLRVVDVVQGPSTTVSWQTALTSLFSNSVSAVTLTDPNGRSPAPNGWFRGISPVRFEEFSDSRPARTFATLQSDVRNPETNRSARMNRPDPSLPLAMGQWTFRTIADEQSPAPLLPTFVLEKVNGEWRVAIGADKGRFVSGALRVGGSWFTLSGGSPGSAGTQVLTATPAILPVEDWNVRSRAEYANTLYADNPKFEPGLALELPGTRDRSRAIDALLFSGSWACIYLYEQDASPTLLAQTDSGSGEAFQHRESTIWRVVVPLNPVDRVPPRYMYKVPPAIPASMPVEILHPAQPAGPAKNGTPP